MIRLLILRLHRRWLHSALASVRQSMADAAESESAFCEELKRTEAAIAMAKAERRMQRYRALP
jgi:flagellar hook-basal body complex protein FliE